jgi:hypothetical protein
VRELSNEAHDPIGLTDAQLVGLFATLCEVVDGGIDVGSLEQAFVDAPLIDGVAAELAALTMKECNDV